MPGRAGCEAHPRRRAAINLRGTAFLGSLVDGDIFALNLFTGDGEVISERPGTPSAGLKVDLRGRLFVSGGPSGQARVVDSRSGDVWRPMSSAAGRPSSTTSC